MRQDIPQEQFTLRQESQVVDFFGLKVPVEALEHPVVIAALCLVAVVMIGYVIHKLSSKNSRYY